VIDDGVCAEDRGNHFCDSGRDAVATTVSPVRRRAS